MEVKVFYTFNKNGVRIKKCCASCKSKEIGKKEDERICMKGEGQVTKDYVCEDWSISETIDNIKMEGFGAVKKPHYIRWMRREIALIADSPSISQSQKNMLIQQLPKRYENEHGKRYY